MRKSFLPKLTVLAAVFALALTGCQSKSNNTTSTETSASESAETTAAETTAAEAKTVEVTDIHGTVTVPVNPKTVVALDNRTFETLSDWGIKLAAVPKGVMPADSSYVADSEVQDIGNHSEPNLEIIAAADPELVIVGQRFSSYYEEIKKLVPNAAVVDLSFQISKEAGKSGESFTNGLKDSTITLGKIFNKNEEAEKLNADFDQAIEKAKSAYNGTDKIMSVVVSGGDIGFSAPVSGRVWGPLYEVFGWTSALEVSGATSDHQGDDISVEAIAQSNPDWIFVLDRDAAISSTKDAVPAQDVINNSPALQNTTAITKGQVVYAPNDTYTNESIQTFIELFDNLAKSLTK
ncbi:MULTISPECIES: siderophore ABC transporter substrate-binding protein [Clostridia]|jgi:iron complex transport system substrate-binding protein|uniref:Siderophore ABC transporter substrate-binding protein n=1 Tax=Lacrimispora xylanolytica TaxID=29375 RepID=A0ABY7ACK4_9FIRM|nr:MULTISPECIES: siderophore ABC transporter substrate-binding protein [Clostridia]WAJ24154.1 siderophore ABC transporter substrate-binding protein [Lacrimispora xylanolytica]